jgi:metal-sulfur cluster biosynthetic enzyme
MTPRDDVVEQLRGVIDPELGIDVVSLGLIYDIAIDNDHVAIEMTLTVPGCPMHATILRDVEQAVRSNFWVHDVDVKLVFEPPWTPALLSPEARTALAR